MLFESSSCLHVHKSRKRSPSSPLLLILVLIYQDVLGSLHRLLNVIRHIQFLLDLPPHIWTCLAFLLRYDMLFFSARPNSIHGIENRLIKNLDTQSVLLDRVVRIPWGSG